jgi:hypothetical protein
VMVMAVMHAVPPIDSEISTGHCRLPVWAVQEHVANPHYHSSRGTVEKPE